MQFTGKVAIVTGASRGIGRRMVERFAAAGAQVAFCARNPDSVAGLERAVPGTLGIVADVGRPEQVARLADAALARFGRIDVLVNNVGIAGPTKPVEEIDPAEWDETLRANLTGAFLCIRAVVPAMKRQGGGAIVNIGSITGKRPLLFRVPYAASKLGIVGLTRTLAQELGPSGIRVNTVSPGPVAGERLEEVIAGQAEKRGASIEQVREMMLSVSPLGQVADTDSIANMALYLASDLARHMTGQDINVSAGQVMY